MIRVKDINTGEWKIRRKKYRKLKEMYQSRPSVVKKLLNWAGHRATYRNDEWALLRMMLENDAHRPKATGPPEIKMGGHDGVKEVAEKINPGEDWKKLSFRKGKLEANVNDDVMVLKAPKKSSELIGEGYVMATNTRRIV